MPAPTTLEGFEDVTPAETPTRRFDLDGFVDASPKLEGFTDVTGPLLDSPRVKRRKQVAEFKADVNPISGTEFGRGVAKGALSMGAGVSGFGEALADLIGADSAKAWLRDKGDRLDQINAAIPQAVENFTQIESPGDVAAYTLASIGELAPQIIASLGAGVGLKAAGLGVKTAAVIGAAATSYPQEAGGMYRGIREETGKEAPGTALAFGVPAAALDTLTPARFLGKIFSGAAGDEVKRKGWNALVRESFKEAKNTGLIEGVTEVGQESIAVTANRFADATYPLLTEKNGIRLIDAGLKGLIGGTAIGGTAPTLERLAKGGQPKPVEVSAPRQETGGIDDTPPRLVEKLGGFSTEEWDVRAGIKEARDARRSDNPMSSDVIPQMPTGPIEEQKALPTAALDAVTVTPPSKTIFDPGGETLGTAPAGPTFYSRLQRTVEESKQQKASGAQWKATIRQSKTGANADEFALVGADNLEDAKPYTKAEVLTFLRDNEIQVKEVELSQPLGQDTLDARRQAAAQRIFGRAWDDLNGDERLRASEAASPAATHYSQYQLGGGEPGTYREWVLNVPRNPLDSITTRIADASGNLHPDWGKRLDWRDGHSAYADIPNPVVRLRGAIHQTVDGKRLLLIEEVQAPSKDNFSKMPALFQAKWRDIAFKFAIRKAAELDAEMVGWTTGAQQAARYSLSTQVESIKWEPREGNVVGQRVIVKPVGGMSFQIITGENGIVTEDATGNASRFIGKPIADVVGKDVSEKITSQPVGELIGEGLKIGGEGLKRTYDVDFRNVVNSLPSVKRAGVRVGTAEISTDRYATLIGNSPKLETVHAIPIPSDLRASVLQGQPLAFQPSATPLPAGTTAQPTHSATSLSEALSILSDPTSGIDRTVARALTSALSTPGFTKAAAAAGFGLDVVASTNALLGGSAARFDPTTGILMLAYNTTDPLTGPHEVAHAMEQFLTPDRKAFVRKERSAALAKALKRSNLTTTQREFLQQIATQERTSDWFRAQFEKDGTQLLEFYPLVNGSEFFAQSFASWFNQRHATSTGYRAFIDAIKTFLTRVYDALRRAFGIQSLESIHRSLVNGDFKVTLDTGTILGTRDPLGSMPQFWTTRQKADEVMSLRGIDPQRLAEAQRLANVQGGMVPDATAYRVDQLQLGRNTPEGYAKRLLGFLADLRRVAQSPASISTLPRGTPEEERVGNVAGNQLIGHHTIITQQRTRFEAEAAEKQNELTDAVNNELPKATAANLKAGFLQQLAARLIRDFGDHVNNLARTLTAGKNYDAAADAEIRRVQENVNQQARNPAGLAQAIEKIADAIPDTMLVPGVTPIDIANWVAGNQPLRATLGQANLNFLISPIMGTSPLAQYSELRERLATIRRIKQDGAAAEAAVQSFKTWFQTLHAGGRHASPLAVAKAYFKFRTASNLAADIATGINDKIARLDREIGGSLLAAEILEQMIASQEYRANLTVASQYADVVVRDMVETGGTGMTRYVGPLTQAVYTVDLTPGKTQEQENMRQLIEFVAEIERYLATPDADPILSRSYAPLRDYIKTHLIDPWLSPENTSLSRTWKIGPFNVPIGKAFGLVNAGFRAIHLSIQTPQSLLERIGGRQARMTLHEYQLDDYVTTKFRPLNEDAGHGIHAQNLKNRAAAVAHGLPDTPFGIRVWQDEVIEPLFASRQNDLDVPMRVGDPTPSGRIITALDMEAAQSMKRFEDVIIRTVQNTEPGGHTVQAYNPIRVEMKNIAGRTGTRKAVGYGDMTVARHFHNWARGWVRTWLAADTPARKLAALQNRQDFVEAALRRVSETNPEYHGQSTDATQQAVYRDLAYEMKRNRMTFQNIGELLDRIATDRFQALQANQNTSLAAQRQIAEEVLLADISSDVAAFNRQVEAVEPWTKAGGKPATLDEITSATNSFTTARKALVAPSSYYQYGIASDAAKMQFQHGARQIFQLRKIEAMTRLLDVLKAKQEEWKKRVNDLMRAGTPESKATETIKEETRRAVEQGDFMADWSDLNEIVKDLSVTLDELTRITQQSAEKYYSEALGFVMHVQGTLASQLLAGIGSIISNLSGATNVTTALRDAQLGAWNPVFAAKEAVRRSARMAGVALSGMANINNRGIVRALRRHGPAFQAMAQSIDDFAELWSSGRMADERIGAVSPYQFRQRMALQSAFKRTGGRVEFDPPPALVAGLNRILSAPGVRQVVEGIKATMPRATDQLANIANSQEIQRMIDELKAKAVRAWSAREATGHPNWRDTTTSAGLLTNRELGFKKGRDARYYRDYFSSIGQLERITLRYYDAKKADPDAKILTEGEEDTLLLEYLKMTNLPTESNRPLSVKGSPVRTFIGLFRGWPAHMWQQIEKLFVQHKGDEANWLPAIASIVMLMLMAAIIGALNREAGYEIKELWTGETTKDIRLPSVAESGDIKDLLRYTALAWANTLPYVGEVANRAFGGTSSRPLMDATALVPILGLAQSTIDTMERIVTTGDPVYPMVDYIRRWSPVTQPVLNRLPGIEGDIANRNATRAIQSSVPPGMEIREMGGGRFRGTPMTPILRDIVSAAYTGDQAKMQAAIARGVAYKEQQGALDGAAELWQNLKGYMPARRLFGRDITATEEGRLIGRMTERQRGHYDQSKQAFAMIGSTLTGMKKTRRASGRRGRRGIGRSRIGRRSGLIGSRRRQRRLRL